GERPRADEREPSAGAARALEGGQREERVLALDQVPHGEHQLALERQSEARPSLGARSRTEVIRVDAVGRERRERSGAPELDHRVEQVLADRGHGGRVGEAGGEEAARERGLSERVQLMGERPPEELVDWYRAADVLVLTSSREGRPNVVLEALSAGCPVLATNAGGTGELLTDPSMLATTRDPEVLGAMLSALLDDPPPPERLRSSVSRLTWERSLDALEGVLDAVARGDSGDPDDGIACRRPEAGHDSER
ncbi:MAG: glycosyltransferase, partial [Planctomycetota bacterium]